jgi:hypothetical protein
MKVITMTAYRRPQYTREVLDALAQCDGIGDWTLLPNVEPGNAEVIAAFRGFKACECRLVVNERRLGLNRNTLAALMRAFHLKADHIVHLEDDTVPSPDALRYFEWGIDYLVEHDPKHTVLLVSGYNKPKSEPKPEQSHLCDTRPIWTPWGWGVDRKRLVWLMTNWCTRNPKCFTCNFRSQYQRTRKELFPVLSRIQNIGYELGENSPTAEWYRANHRTPWVARAPLTGAFTAKESLRHSGSKPDI